MYLNDSDNTTAPMCKETDMCLDPPKSAPEIPDTSNANSEAAKSTGGLPPVNVVVITETPQSNAQSIQGATFSRTTPTRVHQSDCIIGGTVPIKLGSSSFKLMPRKSEAVICSPSPSRAHAKCFMVSRKRRAYSISSPTYSASAEAEKHIKMSTNTAKRDFSSPALSPFLKTEHELLNLTGLSIHSPVHVTSGNVEHTDSPPKTANHNFCPPSASSFSVYNSSPGESIHRNNSGSLSGSIGIRTPCASNKSSPRQVPLTILSTSSQQGPSPLKSCLAGRPPCHSAGFSKMLQSLDGREEMEDMESPPRMQLRSFTNPPNTVTCLGKAWQSGDTSKGHITPRTGGLSVGSASPRTPLPRVTLTPRTPLSGVRNPNSALPVFPLADSFTYYPSPSDDDDVGRMMDSILEGFKGHTPTSVASPGRPLPALNMNAFSSNSLALSVGSVEANPVLMQSRGGSSSALSAELKDHGITECIDKSLTVHDGDAYSCGMEVPQAKAKSVMNPSRSGEYLVDMMKAEARVGAFDAQYGSLSDSDDDQEFVLAFPMSLPPTSEKDNESTPLHDRRVKQRRYGSSSTLGSQHEHTSATSLTSNQASSTSLFGMDIVQEEGLSVSGSGPRIMTPFSGQSLAQWKSIGSFSGLNHRDGEHGSSSSLHRGRSEVSLGSLGLCLEETSGEAGRELRTPPVSFQRAISPPVLAKRTYGPQCLASFVSTDSNTAPLGISQMMFQKD